MVGKLPLDHKWRMRHDTTSIWHRTAAHMRAEATTGRDLKAGARTMIASCHTVTNLSAQRTQTERKVSCFVSRTAGGQRELFLTHLQTRREEIEVMWVSDGADAIEVAGWRVKAPSGMVWGLRTPHTRAQARNPERAPLVAKNSYRFPLFSL